MPSAKERLLRNDEPREGEVAGVAGGVAESLLDTQQLVVLRDAFAAGLDILAEGFLTVEGTDPDIRKAMNSLSAESRPKTSRMAIRKPQGMISRRDIGRIAAMNFQMIPKSRSGRATS